MIKIGIFGVGYLGNYHIKNLIEIKEIIIVGFYDPDDTRAIEAIKNYNIIRYFNVESLMDVSDIVDIVTPTCNHFDLCLLAFKKRKHVFIEKPLVETVIQGEYLKQQLKELDIKVQIGHIERFNPAFKFIQNKIKAPTLIECNRFCPIQKRGLDISVILDLMIHDIDLVLYLTRSEIISISVIGVKIVSEFADIVNVQIKFNSGCLAFLNVNRVSSESVRQLKILDGKRYYEVDLLNRSVHLQNISELNLDDSIKYLHRRNKHTNGSIKTFGYDYNPLYEELKSFINAIKYNRQPLVTLNDGLNALKIAHSIIEINNL